MNRSRRSISELMNIRPEYANLKVGNETKKVKPEEVKVGDRIVVKPGEKIPLDGLVIEGFSLVDTSALTGESVPRDVEAGKEVLAGFVNQNGILEIEVQKGLSESAVTKILDLVENASKLEKHRQKTLSQSLQNTIHRLSLYWHCRLPLCRRFSFHQLNCLTGFTGHSFS